MLQNIDRDLVPMKAHYFLYNAATGPIVPFLPTIAKQLGFSATLVGTIYSVLPISGLISKPLFGGLADKFKLHKVFFLIFQVVLTLAFFSISYIPNTDRNANITLICDNNIAFLQICPEKQFSKETLNNVLVNDVLDKHTKSVCQLTCQGPSHGYMEVSDRNVSKYEKFKFDGIFDMYQDLPLKDCVEVKIRTIQDDSVHPPVCGNRMRTWCTVNCNQIFVSLNNLLKEAKKLNSDAEVYTHRFYLFLSAAIVSWVGMAVVVSIGDAICFDLLGYERRKDYGKQKMWGSIGFGIFGISAGYLVDVFSKGQNEKNYDCIFYIMLIAMILDFIASATLRKKNSECNRDEPSLLWELLNVAKEGRVLVFGWWCIGAGMCTGVIWNFLFWYTEDLMTSTWVKTLQGFLTGIQCFLGELPFNFLSGSVLKKLGHVNVMSLVLLVYAIRFMAYSIISNPWLFLILELLHGPSFGLCWPTMVSYGDKVTPSGTKATMQGFVGAIFEGIGVSSGSFICGWLIDTYGGATAFRVFSVGALLWLSAFWTMELILRKFKANPVHQGHNHLANYANPDDAILMTISQELQTY
ncbi:PREDICTED: major facilitator superfamily domain-containing protein 6 [Dinoponera quadriceps]|uniref:Major facilitator superfamily domain-containing protein 6 n=1 Tax=Dinoponera quadriceps TaxID=609295 RepID=A0A6P3X938_DINQU|nr:PREDICTED: major facilitator superfamily domain-containing protein 6 [Dinoponera quadriceps]